MSPPEFNSQDDLKLKGEILALQATHFNPYEDAFPQTRNIAIYQALEQMQSSPDGERHLITGIINLLKRTKQQIEEGQITIKHTALRYYPNAIPVSLTEEVKKRALWWNNLATGVAEKCGIQGLINDPSLMCLALGTAQWLDTGNFMVEPRFVGSSLKYPTVPDIDLYAAFGLNQDDRVFFPHLKHKPGFYFPEYAHLLCDQQGPSLPGFLRSFRLISDLLHAQDQRKIKPVLLAPGTWFLDPNLPEIDSRFAWLKEVAIGKIIIVGPADEISPIHVQFALQQSEKRRKMHEEGKYRPQLAAQCVTLKEVDTLLKKHGY